MITLAEKLADVTHRIADAEQRLAEHQERIWGGDCEDALEGAFMLYMAASALRELRAHKARLEEIAGQGVTLLRSPE